MNRKVEASKQTVFLSEH